MFRIAIMQPYFVPYAGYFRLLSDADLFVIYDCVQFPRRGYVHRNRLPDADGLPQWFALPLTKAGRETEIRNMRFADDAVARLTSARRRFPSLAQLPPEWEALFSAAQGPITPWLRSSLELCCHHLDIDCPMICSSELNIPPAIRGQNRIIEICKTLGASHYLNAPGGRELYAPDIFHAEGISLEFLPAFEGATWSVLFDIAKAWQSSGGS